MSLRESFAEWAVRRLSPHIPRDAALKLGDELVAIVREEDAKKSLPCEHRWQKNAARGATTRTCLRCGKIEAVTPCPTCIGRGSIPMGGVCPVCHPEGRCDCGSPLCQVCCPPTDGRPL